MRHAWYILGHVLQLSRIMNIKKRNRLQSMQEHGNNFKTSYRLQRTCAGSSTSKALPERPSAEERKPGTAGSCPYNASPLRGICESN